MSDFKEIKDGFLKLWIQFQDIHQLWNSFGSGPKEKVENESTLRQRKFTLRSNLKTDKTILDRIIEWKIPLIVLKYLRSFRTLHYVNVNRPNCEYMNIYLDLHR